MKKKGQTGAIFGVVAVVAFILAIIIAFAGFDSVDANHLGVKVRFGQIQGIQRPSLQWTGLFTDSYRYDMRTRKDVIELQGDNGAVDKTGQAVYATININYRIRQDTGAEAEQVVQDLYVNVGTDDVIDDKMNIDAIAREGLKTVTAQYDALEIIEKRQEVKDKAIENIKKNFPNHYFEVQNIVITNIDFSKGFKEAIESKKVAEQTAEKEKNNLETVKFQQEQEITKYKAEAEKMRLQKSELNDLLIKQALIAKWDGVLSQYMIITDQSQGMFLQLAKGNIDEAVSPVK